MSDSPAVRPQRDPSACDPATPESANSPLTGGPAPPALLCELEPWHRVFFRNLGDVLLHRQPPPLELTAQPVPLRPGYFIRTGIDAYRFAESYAGHIAFIIVVYLVCTLPFFNRAPNLRSPFENTKVEYYPVSEYLPPINTASKAPVKPRKGAPKLAKQEILSVPPAAGQQPPDHRHPAQGQAGSRCAAAQHRSLDARARSPADCRLARSVSQLKVPQFETQVVAPDRRCLATQVEAATPHAAAAFGGRASVVSRPVEAAKGRAQHGATAARRWPLPSCRCRRSGPAASATAARRTFHPLPTCRTFPLAGTGTTDRVGTEPG